MRNYLAIQHISKSYYQALSVDLPDITYNKWCREGETPETATRRPSEEDVDVISFPQTWGSTALGFGGIGGSAITDAQTVLIVFGNLAAVYFGGRLAYICKNNEAFQELVLNRNMPSVRDSEELLTIISSD